MSKLSDVDLDALFFLFKGEPGTRKSTCAASFPGKQYWFSSDRKMEALITPMSKWGRSFDDIEYDDYSDYDVMRAKLEQLKVKCPYKLLVVDSITSMGDNVNRQSIRFKKGTTTQSGQEALTKVGSIALAGMQEYKAEAGAFDEAMDLLKGVSKYHKCHVIFIAHVIGQRKNDANNNLTHHSRVIITGGDKIAGKIASLMTEAYHFNVKPALSVQDEGDYELFTVHTGNDYARTSLPLDRNIIFNNKPLYDSFIGPAIAKLKAQLKRDTSSGTNNQTTINPIKTL